ncbi:MAG: hypothetical protein ACI4HK_08725 [Ruminococcus sp.]
MKIIKNSEAYGNSILDKNFFIENCKLVEPLKKITVFFDYENFLLTNYATDTGTTFVAEGWNGNQIHLTGLSCGYKGTGPNSTAEILNYIGMNLEKAKELMQSPSVEIDFDKSGNFIVDSINRKTFFSSQIEYADDCKIHLNGSTYVNYFEKKLYFINPQYHYTVDLYNAIDTFKPTDFQYFIGDNSSLDNGYFPQSVDCKEKRKLSGVNLSLKGSQLEINVLIDKALARSVINMVYCYITKKPLYDDTDFLQKPKSKFKIFLFDILKSKNICDTGNINLEHLRDKKNDR